MLKMRKGSKGILSLYAVGIVLLVILVGWIWRDVRSSRVEITADQRIDITPEQIQSIKAIGEWEFLSISDEEMVDTIRKGIFSDDHLVRIYYGTMRLGINLKQVESGWISTNGDTLNIMLPQIALLDKDFIDEARTKSFFESGSWSPKDREAMMRRAYQRMLQRGLTPQNLEAARVNGDAQVRQVMQGMGFKHVKIQYKD
ncbi:MAG: DUF4230 domain-containing protein [Prevotella sp.]|jgi:hypothetical protein|nr:DUF4230 domain-containing protein [Prevotella sp.]